jgi:hypothetical protein
MKPDEIEASLRQARVAGSSLTKSQQTGGSTITWANSNALFSASADITFHFVGERLARITATFTESVNLGAIAAEYEGELGRPVEKQLGRDQTQTNTVRWQIAKPAALSIALREAQGTLTAEYGLD